MGAITEITAPFVKYAALLGGVTSVVGDDPNYGRAVLLGAAYGFAELAQRMNMASTLENAFQQICGKIGDLEKKTEEE